MMGNVVTLQWDPNSKGFYTYTLIICTLFGVPSKSVWCGTGALGRHRHTEETLYR